MRLVACNPSHTSRNRGPIIGFASLRGSDRQPNRAIAATGPKPELPRLPTTAAGGLEEYSPIRWLATFPAGIAAGRISRATLRRPIRPPHAALDPFDTAL